MRETRTRVGLVLSVLVIPLLLAVAVLAATDYDLSWHVVGDGGGYAEGGSYCLNATIAQPVAGPSTGGTYHLLAGFWSFAGPVDYTIHLPLALRNH
jgi:hypothetical protein